MPEPARAAVLVTRPEPGASATAARLDALGFDAVLAPVMQIRALPATLPDPARAAAVLVTSGQAIPAIPAAYRQRPLYVVGDATARRARQAGFAAVTSADGDARDLAALVGRAVAPGATLLLVTGRGLGHGLASDLRAAGFAVIRRSVYAQVPAARLPPAAIDALQAGRVRAALFFSAAAATRFAALAGRAVWHNVIRNTDAVAISPAVAVALEALPWRRVIVAARPNQDAMLASLQ